MSDQQPPEPSYEVVWPLGRSTATQIELSGPSAAAGTRRIAFIWDNVGAGDVVFAEIETFLLERYADVEVVGYEHFGDIHGLHEREVIADLPARLHDEQIYAAIVGVGS